MWGGRFTGRPAEAMEEINASIDFDRKLAAQDIAGSEAHLAMLARQGIVEIADAQAIAKGLAQVKGEIEAGTFSFSRALEDIHMNVESRLAEIVGPVAGRLHTARSRNDQVAVDFRLWVRDAIDAVLSQITQLQRALAARALDSAATVMPGFTHLQSAQPVTFGHHLLAYVEMLGRDAGRFKDARKRLNECPLGAAALAGTSFPIDREMTAKALLFDRPTANSLDSVADRDFALESLAAAAITATHLSRFAEEIVLWTTPQFGFVKLSDAFSTGSSIMPQKRNPDAAELVRGKTGRDRWRAHRPAHGDEGAAARLFQGHAGGQGGRVRRLPDPRALSRRDDRHGRGHDAGAQAHEGRSRHGLRDRHRSRRLARAGAQNAVPRSPSRHRPHRRARLNARRGAREAERWTKCRASSRASPARRSTCWASTVRSRAAPLTGEQRRPTCAGRRAPG